MSYARLAANLRGVVPLAAIDPDEIRSPPPPPTAVTFPLYKSDTTYAARPWSSDDLPPPFEQLFAQLKKPKHHRLTDEHVNALNITITSNNPLEDLVPSLRHTHAYLFCSNTDASSKADFQTSQNDYYIRLTELRCENGQAYRNVTRSLRSGEVPKRFSSFRSFWVGLEAASQYWDTTADNYFTVESTDGEAPRHKYCGYRNSTGKDMHPKLLPDIVLGFIQGVVWAFKARVINQLNLMPPKRPCVQLGRLLLELMPRFGPAPCRLHIIHGRPEDETRARKGLNEGPLMGSITRPYIDYASGSEQLQHKLARTDLMYEIWELMVVAQERRREGRTEDLGIGKWWNDKPRCFESPDANKTTYSGRWDDLTIFKAVGKEPGSDWDDVFTVSAMNHHISILKLSVHSAYLDCLETGKLPDPLPADGEWSRPTLKRTKWYDLYNVEDRVAAFKCFWGVMAYLTRKQSNAGQ